MNVRLSKEQKIKILNSEDVSEIMQQILLRENKISRNKEHFWIVCLANNNQILLIELISLGTVKETLVEPMEVFSFALQKRAVKIIMVHNHPSGEIEPSTSDIQITEKMHAIGKFINVPVIDHLIITEKDFYSFLDKGLLDKIRQENKYDLTFGNEATLKKQLKEVENKKATEMAKKMLEDDISLEAIKNYTGLSKKQLEKLRKDS